MALGKRPAPAAHLRMRRRARCAGRRWRRARIPTGTRPSSSPASACRPDHIEPLAFRQQGARAALRAGLQARGFAASLRAPGRGPHPLRRDHHQRRPRWRPRPTPSRRLQTDKSQIKILVRPGGWRHSESLESSNGFRGCWRAFLHPTSTERSWPQWIRGKLRDDLLRPPPAVSGHPRHPSWMTASALCRSWLHIPDR